MITSTLYKTIVDLIDSMDSRGSDISDNYVLMLAHLDEAEGDDQLFERLWFRNSIINGNTLSNNKHIEPSIQLLKFVQELQQHVVDNFGNVNDFLSDSSIQVLPNFAILSDIVGFTIDMVHIEGVAS